MIGLLGLAIFVKYYEKDQKYYTGILFAIFAVSILMDIIWMVIILPSWSEDESTNPEWKGLSTVHSLTAFFSFVELVVKGLMMFLLFKKGATEDFKFVNPFANNFNFK